MSSRQVMPSIPLAAVATTPRTPTSVHTPSPPLGIDRQRLEGGQGAN